MRLGGRFHPSAGAENLALGWQHPLASGLTALPGPVAGVNGVTATLLMSCGAPGGGGDFPGRGQVKGSPGESFVPPELPSDTVSRRGLMLYSA